MKKTPKKDYQAAKRAVAEAAKKPLGEGSRFKAVAKSAKAAGAKDPEAVAAAIGRKKYGAAKMAEMAAKGRRKAAAARKSKK